MKKIKVIFIHYRLVCGGAEQALYDLACLMDRDKFDVAVFALKDDGMWDQKFRDAGIPVLYDYSCRRPTWNPIKKIGNFTKKLRVRRALKSNGAGLMDICCPDADVIINNCSCEYGEVAFSQKAKSVKYIHGDLETNHLYREEEQNRKELLTRYDRIICVSQSARNAFCKVTGLEDGVEAHYNPINSERVREMAREIVKIPDDTPIVCAVGRLSPEKGLERLILVHKKLLEQGVRHRLVLVGEGEDHSFLLRLIRATGTESSVILTGYQDNPYPYMRISKFLVNSSFTEGLPVIAMEALCLGVPVVTTIPAIEEIFGEERCGLITDNSTEGLEMGIRKMLTDEEFYAYIKAGAIRRSAFFDGKRMAGEIESVLETLAQKV